jgi:glycosyltransferase involved in cell wall biosynthesis
LSRTTGDQGDDAIAVPEVDGTISVVLCTFNGEAYLPEQLASVLEQTRAPDELIVCDDGSSDETIPIVEEFARTALFPVRLHRNPTRLGPSANFDSGMGLAQYELIALSDQDDVWLPTRLERQAMAMERHPSVGICFSDAEIIDARSNRTGQRIWERIGFRSEHEFWTADELFSELMRHTVVTGATLMTRRSLLGTVRPVAPNWLHDEWIALIGTAGGADAVAITEPLTEYRMHDEQHTGLQVRRLDLATIRTGRRPISFEVDRSAALLGRAQSLPDMSSLRVGLARARHAHLLGRQQAVRSVPIKRALQVARQVRSGGYHAFSDGWTSAIADLAGRTRDQ